MDRFQSTYHTKHSTETALLNIQIDLLSALDNEEYVIVMIMLDLSAAFDRIYLVFSRLRDMIGSYKHD